VLRIAPDEVTFEHVDAYEEILKPVSPQFLKDPTWWKRQPGQPESILSAIDPKHHAHMRGALAPGFTPRALRAQEPFVQRYINLLVDRIRELAAKHQGSEIDIAPWLMFTTFDIFGDLGFGESFDCLQNSRYHPWIALLFGSVKAAAFVAAARYYPWIEYVLMKCIPTSLKEKQKAHFNQIVDKVRRRLNYEMERPDIMSHVIRKEEDSSQGLPLDEINVTFMVLTTAGSETTATVLTGTVNYLVQCPEKLDRVVSEIRGQFQSETDITLDALRNCTYLNAVINEGLRLCTPVPWVLPRRVPPEGGTVCGVWLPGNTPVSIQAYAMSRDPQYWHRSESYLPERWLPESQNDPKSPFYGDKRQVLQPFSVGPRSCMGQHLAWAEMRLILAKLLWNFDFSAPKDKGKWLRWEDLRTFLLVEKRPIYVRVKPRSHGAQ
jgi:cytochrome P450